MPPNIMFALAENRLNQLKRLSWQTHRITSATHGLIADCAAFAHTNREITRDCAGAALERVDRMRDYAVQVMEQASRARAAIIEAGQAYDAQGGVES